jgi:hypothetical protein
MIYHAYEAYEQMLAPLRWSRDARQRLASERTRLCAPRRSLASKSRTLAPDLTKRARHGTRILIGNRRKPPGCT